MRTNRLALLVLALTLASAPLRAAGTVAGGASWSAAVSEAAIAVSAHPELAASMPTLGGTLGRLRLELALHPDSPSATAWASRLPAGATPAMLAAMPAESRLKVIDAAVAAEAAAARNRAGKLLERADTGGLTRADDAEVKAVAASWLYLDSEQADAVRVLEAERREQRAMGLGEKLAERLSGRRETDSTIAQAELVGVFAGAARLAAEQKGVAPGQGLVRDHLAPYVARALDEAEARAQERGADAGAVYAGLMNGGSHNLILGQAVDRGLFKSLRARGEWTELVSAATLHAGSELSKIGGDWHNALARAAEEDHLRLPIPGWHALYGKFESVAHWLASVHGKPDDAPGGRLLFRAFGVPVYAGRTFGLGVGLIALQMVGAFAKAVPSAPFMAALVGAALLYATVIAHEIGHALAAKAFGIRTRRIVIHALGGGAEVVRGFRQALPEGVIAAAGPVVSVVAGVALVVAAHLVGGPAGAIMRLVGALSGGLGAMNLLPFFPMDGGRIMRAGLTKLFGSYRGTRIASVISLILSLGIAAAGYLSFMNGRNSGLMLALVGMFFAMASKAAGMHAGTVTIDEAKKA